MSREDVENGTVGAPEGVGGQSSIFAMLKQSIRLCGRTLINKLPLSPAAKVRCKYLILSAVGPLVGVERRRRLRSLEDSAARLRANKERYRELAASASGYAANTPPRSVSIVVPVYNQLEHTLRCIEAIEANTSEIEHEIIVVDDCSTDGTQDALSERQDIVYLRNERNMGFVGACNAGAAHAGKTYLCFLNNDTTVLPYWLSALVNTFELHENVGLVGSKLVYPDGRLQEAGGLVWSDGSAWNWGRLKDPHNPRYGYARHADYCSGASILIPRALFESLGGFDAHYAPAYCEDTDLAFKVRSLGLATLYQPLSQVIHFEGVTSGTDTSQGVKKHQVENLEKLAKRWAPVLVHQGRSDNAEVLCDRGVIGHILILDQITPEPDRDAGSLAAIEMMRALRELGYKITFVPCSNFCDMPPYTDLLGALGVESALLPWTGSVRHHLKQRGSSYDAVLIMRPETWRDYIKDIRTYAPQAKIIYHACDLHFLRHQRESDLSDAGAKFVSAKLEASKATELDLIASADLCTVHSTVEKQLIEEERPGTRVVCYPLIYEPQGRGKSMGERSGIVFVGSYRHPPNVDAVEHYAADIHPLVKERLSEAGTLTAVGSFPPPSLTELAGPDIRIPGYVEDISSVLFSARVMVAPLRFGAGVKGKILAAMAHGLPVVTTSVGAEGIADGDELMVADNPREFADAVSRLYSNPELWHRVQGAGLTYLQHNTSRDVGLRALSEALRQLDLPFRGRWVPRDDIGIPSGFGSPLEFSDIGALAEVGRRALPGIERIGLLLLPDSMAAGAALPETVERIATYSQLAQQPPVRSIVAVADPTDPDAMTDLGNALAASLPPDASCAVVIAPQRMMASADGYAMVAPFSDREIDQISLPFHETLERDFQFSGRECSWNVDRTLTGFPALTVLRISKRTGNVA